MKIDNFDVSVVIPTCNGSQGLAYTIQSLLNQTINASAYEIVIVDGGAADDTFEIMKRYEPLVNVKYAYHPGMAPGAAPARNLGIQQATGDICLFVEPGSILKSDCLRQHVEAHRGHGQDVAVIGYDCGYLQPGQTGEELLRLVEPADADESIGNLLARGKFLDPRECIYRKYNYTLEGVEAAWLLFSSRHASVKQKTLLAVGLFDERYDGGGGCEDKDLGLRLQRANVAIRLCREAVALHLPGGAAAEVRPKGNLRDYQYLHSKFQTNETRQFADYYAGQTPGRPDRYDVTELYERIEAARREVEV